VIKKRPAIILFIFLAFGGFFFGLETVLGEDADIPTIINAESLEIELEENKATFLGDVKVTQSQGVLESQELQVIFDKDSGGINTLVAKGKVKITQGGNVGTCEKAIYEFLPHQKVTMEGNPQLKHGKQNFSGETIIFLLDEDRVVIKKKVRGVVFPQKKRELLPLF